jgi:hypothetical protein
VNANNIVAFENVTVDSGGDVFLSGTLNTGTLTATNSGILALDALLTVNGNLVVDSGVTTLEGSTLNVTGSVDIGARATIELLLEAVCPGVLDLATLFTSGTQPTFVAGFLNSQVTLFTTNEGSVGQLLEVTFLGERIFLNAEFDAVPEPSGLALFGPTLLGLIGLRRKRKKAGQKAV